MENTKRLEYLDVTKGFSILLIVLGHIYTKENVINAYMYSFHVPIFFIISGMLLKYKNKDTENIGKIVKSRLKGLIIPYFTFDAFNILIYLFLNGFTYENIRWNIIDTLLLYGRGATWFLPCIFIGEILFLLIKKYLKQDLCVILISTILFLIPIVIHSKGIITLILFRGLIAVGFICLGYYIFNNEKIFNIKSLIVFILLYILIPKNTANAELFSLNFENPVLYILNAVLGSLIVINTFKEIKITKVLTKIGTNTLVIMSTHQSILSLVLYNYDNKFKGNDIQGLLLLLLIMIIEIPIIYIVNNYLPFMLGKFPKKKNVQTVKD